ncbi:MAG: gamma-glutamylcyclotransferase [Hormoscilla sp. GUM202]|nr:gamma-glutamylcyclotransferase [Hormoscilla sp. GUM202]
MLNDLKFFVYGTLKPGEVNYERYCAGKVVASQRAIAMGLLFALPMGFPAMIPGKQPVHGFLLTFNDPTILPTFDELEDYHGDDRPEGVNLYNRIQIEVFQSDGLSLGLAWAYLMTPEQVQQFGGELLPDGCWISI